MVLEKPVGTDARLWLRFVAQHLAAHMPLDVAMHEARLILALALNRDTPILSHEDIRLDTAAYEKLKSCISQRLAGMPISRMRGWREFYGLRFELNADTLDPRPDSEVLIDSALEFVAQKDWQETPISLLDLGTGSGCLLLASLANMPSAHGIGVDISEAALQQAAANANTLGLSQRAQFIRSDWAEALPAERHHIILSNPPYIESGNLGELSPEVGLYDPHKALFAGADGLADYRRLMPIITALLHVEGQAFIEIGYGQAKAVSQLAEAAGLTIKAIHNDLASIPRCLIVARGDR